MVLLWLLSFANTLSLSHHAVHQLLESQSCITPTPQMMADLQALSRALLDTLNDKNMALSHQRKTNKSVTTVPSNKHRNTAWNEWILVYKCILWQYSQLLPHTPEGIHTTTYNHPPASKPTNTPSFRALSSHGTNAHNSQLANNHSTHLVGTCTQYLHTYIIMLYYPPTPAQHHPLLVTNQVR